MFHQDNVSLVEFCEGGKKHVLPVEETCCVMIYLSIYLSIYEIYIAPLQGNYSEALPAQARAKIKVLRSLISLEQARISRGAGEAAETDLSSSLKLLFL